jgi:hypothetical protein
MGARKVDDPKTPLLECRDVTVKNRLIACFLQTFYLSVYSGLRLR